ncbi:MAG: spindle assembly abnormal protein 6-like protein [Amphiamblys sp. WSBS2006]|nr:MAG: spindle assembly abnormal protein 6-like protein [Amphiamblys sp. WSBS2006]
MNTTKTAFKDTVPVFVFETEKDQVLIRKEHSGQTQTEDSHLLRVFLVEIRASAASIDIHVSDSEDPLFVWLATLSEREYPALKSRFHLLVSFRDFPHKTAEFLAAVKAPESLLRAEFSWSDTEKTALLNVTERTAFRETVLFGLELKKAGDREIRRHLGNIISSFRSQIARLQEQLATEKEDQCAKQKEIETELDRVAVLVPGDKKTLVHARLRHMLKSLSEKAVRAEEEKEALLDKNEKLAAAVGGLEKSNRVLEETRDKAEKALRLGEEEVGRLKRLAEKHSADSTLRNSELEGVHRRTGDLKQENAAAKEKIASLTEDVKKANNIIARLQDEKDAAKKKENMYTETKNSLETKLEKIAEETKKKEKTLNEEHEKHSRMEKNLRETTEKNAVLEKELAETKQLLSGNENVIQWLQQQISEEKLLHTLRETEEF